MYFASTGLRTADKKAFAFVRRHFFSAFPFVAYSLKPAWKGLVLYVILFLRAELIVKLLKKLRTLQLFV
jgi:hypothetical protein